MTDRISALINPGGLLYNIEGGGGGGGRWID